MELCKYTKINSVRKVLNVKIRNSTRNFPETVFSYRSIMEFCKRTKTNSERKVLNLKIRNFSPSKNSPFTVKEL